MIRFHHLRPALLALAGLVVAFSAAVPLHAQNFWTKKANLIYAGDTFTVVPFASFNVLGSKVTGTGVLPDTETGIGTFTLVPREGDAIYFAYVLESPLGNPGRANGQFTVVSGTGRYSNATGVGTIRLFRNWPGMGNALHLEGELDY